MLDQQLAIFIDPWLRRPPWNSLPEAVRERLHAKADAQREVARHCVRAIAELDEAFRAQGLPYLLLKGVSLSLRYYGGLQRRSFWDLDLLVREADLSRARGVLHALGYHGLSPLFLGAERTFRFTHAIDYARDGLKLDLHWVLVRHPSFRLDYGRIFAEAEPLEISGLTVQVLGRDAELTFMLLSLFADLQRHRARLRAFVDLDFLLRRATPDWPHFFARRRAERTDTACAAILAMYLRLLARPDGHQDLREHLSQAALRPPPGGDRALWQPTPIAWPGKRWAWRVLRASFLRSALWWAASLPFRAAAHRAFEADRLRALLPWSSGGARG